MYNATIMTEVLNAKKIENKKLIDNSHIRGIVYGKKVKENVKVEFSPQDFSKIYDEIGQSSVFELDVDGKKYDVLIREIQYDHRTDKIHHIDFYAVVNDEVTDATVAIEFVGDTDNIAKAGGVVNTVISEITIKALPKNIPSEFTVDLSNIDLESNNTIRISDLDLPEGVEIIGHDQEDAIVSATMGVSAADAEEAANDKDVSEVLAEEETEEDDKKEEENSEKKEEK